MKQSFVSITVLESSEGNVLTNGQIYTTKAYLGANDSVMNWTEIPIQEVPEEEKENLIAGAG